ncbi:DUF2569 domain-containing protein [Allopusillimonas ginsengisoli]|nr:DUF2569 domain-containing protein [Allopusillimonas ginsengisoli]
MNAKEGMSRIAKLISVLAWVTLALGSIATATATLSDRKPEWSLFFLILALLLVVFAAMQGIVWIMDGFIGNKEAQSNILWPYKRNKRPVTPKFDQVKAAKNAERDLHLRGVGGWLLWLVIVLMVLTPLFGFGQTSNNLGEAEALYPNLIGLPAWQNYKDSSWVLAWIAAGASFTAGYRLFKFHHPGSVSLTIAVLWVTPIATTIADSFLANHFLDVSMADAGMEIIAALIKGLLSASIWTAYLKLSRRVRNTYYMGHTAMTPHSPAPRSEPTL